MEPVLTYQLDWNVSHNQYRIMITTQSRTQLSPIKVESPEEFAAIVLLLSKAGVMIDIKTGDLRVPQRNVGT
jgi:hypothetical protein